MLNRLVNTRVMVPYSTVCTPVHPFIVLFSFVAPVSEAHLGCDSSGVECNERAVFYIYAVVLVLAHKLLSHRFCDTKEQNNHIVFICAYY